MKPKWTGERLESHIHNLTTLEHLHRYALAGEYSAQRSVLDLACGDGYGSALLAKSASRVLGVDIDPGTIATARQKYSAPNLEFRTGRAVAIPADDASFDLVVSFETIEHHDRHGEMLAEIRRVLKPGGLLVMSSPDRKYYSEIPRYKNPFHVKELSESEFKALIRRNFSHATFLAQRAGFLSLLLPEDHPAKIDAYHGSYDAVQPAADWGPLYWTAIASNAPLPASSPRTVFVGDALLSRMGAEVAANVRNTRDFRLGAVLLRPLRALKRLLGKTE